MRLILALAMVAALAGCASDYKRTANDWRTIHTPAPVTPN
jgi:hypothetical protein